MCLFVPVRTARKTHALFVKLTVEIGPLRRKSHLSNLGHFKTKTSSLYKSKNFA